MARQEHTRQERFTSYAAILRERFQTGLLAELQSVSQWVVWRAELDGEGKQKKAPYNPNHRNVYASVKIPKSWGTLDQALIALSSGLYSGIGFMITPPLLLFAHIFATIQPVYDGIQLKTTHSLTLSCRA